VPCCACFRAGGVVWRGKQGSSFQADRSAFRPPHYQCLRRSMPVLATFLHNIPCSDWIPPLQQFTSRLSYPLSASVSRHSLRSDSRAPAICVALLSRAAPFGCRMPPGFPGRNTAFRYAKKTTTPGPTRKKRSWILRAGTIAEGCPRDGQKRINYMTYQNKVELKGFVGADAHTKTLDGGKTVLNFSLATKTSWGTRPGSKKAQHMAPHHCLGWRREQSARSAQGRTPSRSRGAAQP
jgi:hypothetical protein